MNQGDPERPLALILARLPPQTRGRLMQALPGGLRERVGGLLEVAADLPPGEMSFVEQVLNVDLEALSAADEEDAEGPAVREALALRVSDVVAILLRHTPPQQASGVLLSLPPDLQGEALQKVAAMDLGVLERHLAGAEVDFLKGIDAAWPASGEAGPVFVASILRRVSAPPAVRRLLTEMYRVDPESAGKVQDFLYGFEDLVRLTDLELQTVLTGVDQWDLTLALGNASLGLRQRVLANISRRRARYLAEDVEILEEVDAAEVEAIQRRIVERVRGLYEAGKVHAYFGSVGVEEEEEEGPARPSGGRSETEGKPGRGRRGLARVGAVLGGAALTVLLIVWLSGLEPRAPTSGGRTARGAMVGDSEVQRDRSRRRADARPGSGGGASNLAVTSGDVAVVSGNTERPAAGEEVRPGDRVETGETGQAVVRLWGEGGQVQVEPASSVQVGEEGQGRDAPPELSLRLGNVWVYVQNPALEARSPLARVTASEGAVYRLRVVLDAGTTVSVHRGTVWVRCMAGGEGETHVLGPGEGVRILRGGRVIFEDGGPGEGWLGIF